jgi:hypothetical protein
VKKTTVYLDHNILDSLLKNRISNLCDYFTGEEIVYIYSSENLVEIRKSVGYEGKLLAILKDLDAKYLFVENDQRGRITGRFEFQDGDPLDFYCDLDEALSDTTGSNFGLDELIQKLYGGANDKSYSEISLQASQDLDQMLDDALEDIKDELENEQFEVIRSYFSQLKSEMQANSRKMGELFDRETSENNFTTWDDAIGVGPKELNNIEPPRVVEKIWEQVSKDFSEEVTFEKMFGLTSKFEGDVIPSNNIDKCNAIYHTLNFLGYYRDKGMKKLSRVHASSCDMTHAGNAVLCDILLTGDKGLCIKAQAAYEYLDIKTIVVNVNTLN